MSGNVFDDLGIKLQIECARIIEELLKNKWPFSTERDFVIESSYFEILSVFSKLNVLWSCLSRKHQEGNVECRVLFLKRNAL